MLISIIHLLKTVLNYLLLIYLPGFFLSYLFFSHNKIDYIERSILAIALSICSTPIIIFYTNLLGAPINKETVITEVISIFSLTIIIIIIKVLLKRRL
jgi:uncharacterized membrane protein